MSELRRIVRELREDEGVSPETLEALGQLDVAEPEGHVSVQ